MIIAGVIVYNEERMLPGCLASVEDQVDRMIVVDGAYARFPHPEGHPESTDRTRAIAVAFGAEWVPCPSTRSGCTTDGWATQMEKRTAYLIGEEGDWYLLIDADERLVGRLPDPSICQRVDPRLRGDDVREGMWGYAFEIVTRDLRQTWTPRFLPHRGLQGAMRYEGAHNALWSGDHLIRLEDTVRVDPDACRLEHLSHLRGYERQRAKRAWLPERRERERAYRNLHRI